MAFLVRMETANTNIGRERRTERGDCLSKFAFPLFPERNEDTEMLALLTDILWQMGLGSYPALDDWHQLEVVVIVLTDHHFDTRCAFFPAITEFYSQENVHFESNRE